MLQPLPYPQADRLVFISGNALTTDNFPRWHALASSFEKSAAIDPGLADVDTADGPEQLRSLIVSADFFPIVEMQGATLGRTLVESDYSSGGVVMEKTRCRTMKNAAIAGNRKIQPRKKKRTQAPRKSPSTVVAFSSQT